MCVCVCVCVCVFIQKSLTTKFLAAFLTFLFSIDLITHIELFLLRYLFIANLHLFTFINKYFIWFKSISKKDLHQNQGNGKPRTMTILKQNFFTSSLNSLP